MTCSNGATLRRHRRIFQMRINLVIRQQQSPPPHLQIRTFLISAYALTSTTGIAGCTSSMDREAKQAVILSPGSPLRRRVSGRIVHLAYANMYGSGILYHRSPAKQILCCKIMVINSTHTIVRNLPYPIIVCFLYPLFIEGG